MDFVQDFKSCSLRVISADQWVVVIAPILQCSLMDPSNGCATTLVRSNVRLAMYHETPVSRDLDWSQARALTREVQDKKDQATVHMARCLGRTRQLQKKSILHRRPEDGLYGIYFMAPTHPADVAAITNQASVAPSAWRRM